MTSFVFKAVFNLHFIILCLIILQTTTVRADDHNSYLFVGTTFPRILEKDDQNKPVGVSVDLLQKISKITGDTYEVRILPWTRALQMIKRGEASGLIGPYFSLERQKFMDYSDSPFYADKMIFISRAVDEFKWHGDYEQLMGYKILTIKNWFYGTAFEQIREKLNIYEAVSSDNVLDMLYHNRTDLVALNERTARLKIQQNNVERLIRITPHPINIIKGYFGFSKKRSEKSLQTRFNKALTHLYENGEIKSINAQYGLSFSGF
ncbi:transporter substrate-binding domain-containing protein [Terasakiella sp. A23]|uniref:substrate-binding periplasmic protein n=1 Tax=Terasakiella sp. FCG-A23 TaxID=3080561 RepID=UPI0029556D72|nr:transporter substrate-binding domain-containing protein [Terasakiella sp. A23]MDV7339771.1 transporter substrate-binding domain-containing protein [Terasakiella sp. A23]